jgi:hypothetical protein
MIATLFHVSELCADAGITHVNAATSKKTTQRPRLIAQAEILVADSEIGDAEMLERIMGIPLSMKPSVPPEVSAATPRHISHSWSVFIRDIRIWFYLRYHPTARSSDLRRSPKTRNVPVTRLCDIRPLPHSRTPTQSRLTARMKTNGRHPEARFSPNDLCTVLFFSADEFVMNVPTDYPCRSGDKKAAPLFFATVRQSISPLPASQANCFVLFLDPASPLFAFWIC